MDRFYKHLGEDMAWLLPIAGVGIAIATDAPRLMAMIVVGLTVACVVETASVRLPAWRAADMVSVGIVCFALLLERGGMVPASIAFILVSSLGLDEFKPGEIAANTVMLGLFGIELAPLLLS